MFVADDEREDAQGRIRVKLRYMNETQTVVRANPEDTLDQFKQFVLFSYLKMCANKLMNNLLLICCTQFCCTKIIIRVAVMVNYWGIIC